MTNPTTGWDQVPIVGTWLNLDNTPKSGKIQFTLTERVNRTDGTAIYPRGGKLIVSLASTGLGAGSITTSFPASDDPDIMQTGWQIFVEEQLSDGSGQNYYIQPKLSDLPGGINLNLVVVSSIAPDTPDPVYMRSKPGGLAGLNSSGQVINAAGTPVTGGGGSTTLAGLTDVTTAGATTGQALVVTGAGPVWGPGTVATSWTSITGKPTFATVATSGAYADLSGKPTIPSTAAAVGAIPTTEKGAASGVTPLDSSTRIATAFMPAGLGMFNIEGGTSYGSDINPTGLSVWVGPDAPPSPKVNDLWLQAM
jgi:hypothetical protein